MLDGILDYGEVEALALAKEFGHILLIDEKKGRKIALTLNIKIIGFLGILRLNYHQGKIDKSEAKALINKVKSFQFRLSEKLETRFFTLLS